MALVRFGNCKRGWAMCTEQVKVRFPGPESLITTWNPSCNKSICTHLFMSPEDKQLGFGFVSLSRLNAYLSCSSYYSIGRMSLLSFSSLSRSAFSCHCQETGKTPRRQSPLLTHIVTYVSNHTSPQEYWLHTRVFSSVTSDN